MSSLTGFTGLIFLAVAAISLLLVVVVGLKRPWVATVAAIASLAFVPYWLGASVGVFFVNVHLLALALALVGMFVSQNVRFRFHVVDLVLACVLLVTLGLVAAGLSTLTQAYTFFQWLLAYWFARYAAACFGIGRIASVFAVVFTIAAVGLVAEFLTGVNLWTTYVKVNNSLYQTWGILQSRGGVVRAEGAFGHSIAAGCSLALAAILSLNARLKLWVRVMCVTLISAAVLTTLSRTAIVTVALGVGLAMVFAKISLSLRAKIAILTVMGVGAVVYALQLSEVFAEAGAEASNSAAYRFWLLDLLPYLQPFGYATNASRSTAGTLTFGDYRSVDNAVLYYALTNGWVPTLVLMGLVAAAVVAVIRLRAGVATIALVAAIPALFTVALITQYALVFWVVAGLAVSETLSTGAPPPDPVLHPAARGREPAVAAKVEESRQC